MMKNKTVKIVMNGVILAAAAGIGLAAFQLGTSSKEDTAPQELVMENGKTDSEASISDKEEFLVDAGTSQVEAEMETKKIGDTEESADDEAEINASGMNNEDISESANTESVQPEETTDVSADIFAAPVLDFTEETVTEWPVSGNILLDYSMDYTTYFPTLDQYRLSPAIAVQAVEGAPVYAACAGSVFEIKETAQTGTTVTMELGNGYQAIYGQLKDLTVEQGETVRKGAVIGYINSPTKYYSTEGSNLYFAMKKDGEPIDPILYLP